MFLLWMTSITFLLNITFSWMSTPKTEFRPSSNVTLKMDFSKWNLHMIKLKKDKCSTVSHVSSESDKGSKHSRKRSVRCRASSNLAACQRFGETRCPHLQDKFSPRTRLSCWASIPFCPLSSFSPSWLSLPHWCTEKGSFLLARTRSHLPSPSRGSDWPIPLASC